MSAQRCPVCDGRGLVPWNFYMLHGGDATCATPPAPLRCQACEGRGVLWPHDQPVPKVTYTSSHATSHLFNPDVLRAFFWGK